MALNSVHDIGISISIIIGCILLLLSLLFWFLHLRHHRKNPIYRVRHPIFWSICLCVGAIQIILRCMLQYLRINTYITIQTYQLIQPFITMLLSFAFPFARYRNYYTLSIHINQLFI